MNTRFHPALHQLQRHRRAKRLRDIVAGIACLAIIWSVILMALFAISGAGQ